MNESTQRSDASGDESTQRPTAAKDDPTETGEYDSRFLERTVPELADSIRKTSFWAAIVLPFLYVPILIHGLTSWVLSTAFLLLLAINLVALYLGHYHRR